MVVAIGGYMKCDEIKRRYYEASPNNINNLQITLYEFPK